MSGTTRVSRHQKGKTRQVKTNLDLLEQEIVSGSGICWAICKSAPHPRQPCQHPTTQFFTGRMPFLTPNQQCQSTEGNYWTNKAGGKRVNREILITEMPQCTARLRNMGTFHPIQDGKFSKQTEEAWMWRSAVCILVKVVCQDMHY